MKEREEIKLPIIKSVFRGALIPFVAIILAYSMSCFAADRDDGDFWNPLKMSQMAGEVLSPEEMEWFREYKWFEQARKVAEGVASSDEANDAVDAVEAQIEMYVTIEVVVRESKISLVDAVLFGVSREIKMLRAQRLILQKFFEYRYSVPIRPANKNLQVSAFRAADTFPKIPFYIPGTREIGEFLVIPRVSDAGYLEYHISFLDLTSIDLKRDTLVVEHKDIKALINGLLKIHEWTDVAQKNGITRRVSKTSSCIPEGYCSEKIQGRTSTEVVFQVYEDGSTSGRIQRNKGKFSDGYNMSVESSVLLAAYLVYMRDVGSREFNVGVMSDEEIKDLFE